MSVKDSIRAGIDSIIKGDMDAAAKYFSVVMPEKSREILRGEVGNEELSDEELDNVEEVTDEDDEVTSEDDLDIFDGEEDSEKT